MKTWNIQYKDDYASLDDVFAILLSNRGLVKKNDIQEFLFPDLSKITFQSVGLDLTQLEKGVKRVRKAQKLNQKIVIFGDYDVDGITGTAILWESIYKEYKNVTPYIPDRFGEGYGLSIKGIDNLLIKNPDTKLIITVDNGIVAYEAVKHAKKLGIDVIVTDHHVKGEQELSCFALVHTPEICGAAVSFMFSLALKNQEVIDTDEYLDLVALATIADLVPLNKASRAFVKFGLEALLVTNRPGLQALFQLAGIGKEKLGVYEVGHMIGPRLNASGRILSAMDSLRLLCTKKFDRAQQLAIKLDKTNKERQLLTQNHTDQAKSVYKITSDSRIAFIAHTEFNEGVIGLVASRLVEEYYRPSFVVSIGEKVSKGSARSITGVNIIQMIRSVSTHIVQAGGHPMAAGFTVETVKIEELKKALEKQAETIVLDEYLQRKLNIDLELNFKDINLDLYKKIQLLSPFGMKNPEPVFVSRKVKIEDFRAIGANGKHLKLTLSQDGKGNNVYKFSCVAFGMGERGKELKEGNTIDIAYTIDLDTWRGSNKLQLKIKDIT